MSRSLTFLPLFLCALFWIIPARAGQQIAVYDVYASGFKAVTAKLVIDTRGERYDLSLLAETQGLLGKLAPWHGRFDTQGWSIKGQFRPELHMSSAVWREDTEIKKYSYAKNGAFIKLVTTENGRKPVTEIPDKNLTDGTIDALTASFLVFKDIAAGKSCEGSSDVFDGARRFKQVFAAQGTEILKRSTYNIFEGKAQRCTVEVIPVAGEWHEKPRGWLSIQEQGRSRGTMPTVWAAQIAPGETAIPVKIMVKTAYGTLFMHLTDYKNIPNSSDRTTPKEKL